jgi:hypothetical protein
LHGRRLPSPFPLLALPWLLTLGCGSDALPDPNAPDRSPAAGSAFDAATAGSISGRVTWAGARPTVPRFPVWGEPSLTSIIGPRRWEDNPNAPLIHPETRGVANAVIYLRGIDPCRGRRWDHPPVCVEQRDYRLQVRQGEAVANVGFVHRGDAVDMVSRQPVFHALHAGGGAFFTLAFPDPGDVASRRLEEKGLVELTSAAGYYWMRGYLFVDEHPYYTRTDAEGRFRLPAVPPGPCEVVCWLPDWREAQHERDPESGLVTRLTFRPPLEMVQPVVLPEREARTVDFSIRTPPDREP